MKKIIPLMLLPALLPVLLTGCTVKAVGDPNRPITINANVVIDIRGLKQTATNIEDMVAKGA
ncbi:MAG: YnbE family lipoprotein [Candidatus Omnitrophica bacterium]|nr:YnbE family lipoprotein [Candidatus Omnitrophota bacterium]